MIAFTRKARLIKRQRKLEVERGGIQAELNSIKAQIQLHRGTSIHQRDQMDKFHRRLGEIEVELAHIAADQRALDKESTAIRSYVIDER